MIKLDIVIDDEYIDIYDSIENCPNYDLFNGSLFRFNYDNLEYIGINLY